MFKQPLGDHAQNAQAQLTFAARPRRAASKDGVYAHAMSRYSLECDIQASQLKPKKIPYEEFLKTRHFRMFKEPPTTDQISNLTSKVLEILRYYVADKESFRAFDAVVYREPPQVTCASQLDNDLTRSDEQSGF